MSDAHFNERKKEIENDQIRMDKWDEPLIPDRMAILRDLVKTVKHILVYLDEINETLSDDDGLLDELAEDLRGLDERVKVLERRFTSDG